MILDERGCLCPLPVIALGRAAAAGARSIELLADDPAALTDVPAWCRMRNARLEGIAELPGGGWRFQVEVDPGV